MDKKISITYKGLDLECAGYFTEEEKGDYYQPSSPAQFTLETIMYKGIDVTDLLYTMDVDLDDLEGFCLDYIID